MKIKYYIALLSLVFIISGCSTPNYNNEPPVIYTQYVYENNPTKLTRVTEIDGKRIDPLRHAVKVKPGQHHLTLVTETPYQTGQGPSIQFKSEFVRGKTYMFKFDKDQVIQAPTCSPCNQSGRWVLIYE